MPHTSSFACFLHNSWRAPRRAASTIRSSPRPAGPAGRRGGDTLRSAPAAWAASAALPRAPSWALPPLAGTELRSPPGPQREGGRRLPRLPSGTRWHRDTAPGPPPGGGGAGGPSALLPSAPSPSRPLPPAAPSPFLSPSLLPPHPPF